MTPQMTPQEIRDWVAARVPGDSVDAVLSVLEGVVDGSLDAVYASLNEERLRRFWRRQAESWATKNIAAHEEALAKATAGLADDPSNSYFTREHVAYIEHELDLLRKRDGDLLVREEFTPFLGQPASDCPSVRVEHRGRDQGA